MQFERQNLAPSFAFFTHRDFDSVISGNSSGILFSFADICIEFFFSATCMVNGFISS